MANLKNFINNVPDYPRPGIIFKDLTPILDDPQAYNFAINALASIILEEFPETTHIIAPEARGFWFGCPAAAVCELGFVPVRKPGKLPRETINASFELEYGSETLCIHIDALKPGDKIVIIDDVLATGGTLGAMERLVEQSGAETLAALVILELSFLKGRKNVKSPVRPVLID